MNWKNIVSEFLQKLNAKLEPTKGFPFLSDDGERLEGMNIIHKGGASLPYGVTATKRAKPFKGIISHHPASAKGASVAGLIKYINTPRPPNGYMFGYHFVIDTDGTIYQAAPLTKRTNHIKTPRKPLIYNEGKRESPRNSVAPHLTNANTIGICFHLASHRPNMAPTELQTRAGKRLIKVLEKVYNVSLAVYGHGEIQTDKQPQEGRVFAELTRNQGKGVKI